MTTTVHISGQNNAPKETYLCILESLKELERASQDAFDRVESATSRRFNSLGEIETRIAGVRSRIEAVAKNRKAIKVESSSQYPVSGGFKSSNSVFDNSYVSWSEREKNISLYADKEKDEELRMVVGSTKKLEELSQGGWRIKGEDTRELFHFFANYANNKYKGESQSSAAGQKKFGKVPKSLDSVDSMLLYGTDRNIFRMGGDDLVQDKANDSDIEDGEDESTSLLANSLLPNLEIADAPHTMQTNSSKLASMQPVEFGFRPTLNDVPTLELPSMLPDLDSIADDIQFQLPQSEERISAKGIAPSATLVNSLPELDSSVASIGSQPTAGMEGNQAERASNANPSSSGSGQTPPPPPPPPPPSGPGLVPPPPSAPAAQAESAQAASQPPPPPPQSAPPPPPPVAAKSAQPEGRSALLDAIRKASVVNLKKVSQEEEPGKGSNRPPQESSASSSLDAHSAMLDAIKGGARRQLQKPKERLPSMMPVLKEEPGDMMSDLKRQLTRRRTTVLGKQVERPVQKLPPTQQEEEGETEADKILGLKEWIEFQESSDEESSDSDSWDD